MTAAMIFKEIEALPTGEKAKLFKKLELGTNGTAKAQKVSEKELFRIIENIGRQLRTSLTAKEMNAARLEGRK